MKRFLYILLLLVVAASVYGIYLFYKKPPDTRSMKADYEISSADLLKAFTANEEEASKKFVDKILIVSGKVTQMDTVSSTVFLDASDPLATVTCSFYADESASLVKIKQGDLVSIKGKCTGKLMDVVLNNCSLNIK